MSIHRGRDGVVEVGDDAVLQLQSWSFTTTEAQIETDAMGDEWGDTLGDIKRASGDIVFYDDDSSSGNGQAALTVGAVVTLRLYGRGDGTGASYHTLSARISEVSRPVQKGDVVTVTANWVSKGAVTTATVGAG